jgi:Abnormal spindle-like microcephaly-assoc'd, ASPM-SPD-2-Hydin
MESPLLRQFLHNSSRQARRLSPVACGLSSIIVVFILSGCTAYHPVAASSDAAIALSATSFNFKTVVLGQTVNQTLHISNPGKEPLQITSLALSDKQFVISGPSVPRMVLPNMSLDYTLAFTPTTAGSASAALKIQSNAVNSVASVSLSGVGKKVLATVEVSPVSLNFGNSTLQTTSSKNVTLQNTGDINVTLSGITVVGAGFGYSDLSPGFSLAPNQSVTFQVWFRPTVKGAASGTVSILSANLAAPASLSVAGDGITSTTTTPPTAPSPTQHTVHLTWNDSGSSIAGYRVYRSQSSSGSFQAISSSLVSLTDYADDSVVSGSTYYYAITAVSSSGTESAYSNEAKAVIPTP